ncbi:hypothetical protein ANABIO32_29460 [Rossellomorea marisflavi]|nr:hypothetical protein ANABIO32_29460 [Rossellomorea marisflavi]
MGHGRIREWSHDDRWRCTEKMAEQVLFSSLQISTLYPIGTPCEMDVKDL